MTNFVMNNFQDFLGLFGRQVEVEKRDAPEDENLDAREEVRIKVFFTVSGYFTCHDNTIKLFSLQL